MLIDFDADCRCRMPHAACRIISPRDAATALSLCLSLSLDGQADSVLCCPKCPVVLPHTPRAQQSLQHFIAQSQWRLRCAGADVDCDCNCDTWVQTSRLLPPDNALIALQRQPVGDQSSYCSGLGSALPAIQFRYSSCSLLLLLGQKGATFRDSPELSCTSSCQLFVPAA